MKKIFSIMIALVLTLSCLPLSLFAVSAEETNTVKRYSVLVLDVSDTASFIGEHGEQISAELLTEITETLQFIETLIAGGQGVDSSAEVESVVSDIEEIKSILSKHFSGLE